MNSCSHAESSAQSPLKDHSQRIWFKNSGLMTRYGTLFRRVIQFHFKLADTPESGFFNLMFYYDFYFRGIENHLVAHSQSPYLTDELAIKTALEKLAASPHRSVEVWETGRRIYVSSRR